MKTCRSLRRGFWIAAAVACSVGCSRAKGAEPEGKAKSPVPSVAAAPVSTAEIAVAPLDGSVRGWELGRSYSYKVKLATRVDFEGAGNDFDFDVVGTLSIVPAKVDAESAMLSARIPDARIVTRVPGSQGELDKLAAEIRASGAVFEVAGGRTGALFVPTATSQMAASTYRHVASALQFARASDGSTSYTTEERDTTGTYVAVYSLGSESNLWQKRKVRYLGLLGAESLPEEARGRVLPEVTSSRGEIRLSPDGRPVSVKLLDEMTLKGAQIPLASTETVELEATADDHPIAPRVELEVLLAQSKRYGADEPIRDPNASRALDDAKMAGLDFDAILKRVEKRAKDKANARPAEPGSQPGSPAEIARSEQDLKEQERLFLGLTARLKNEPGATSKAVSRVLANSPATDVLVDSLGSVGTPDAHRALARILGTTKVSDKVVGRVIMALARTPEPTKEASDALKAVLKGSPHSPGALYGLGTHSRLYRDKGKVKDAAELGEFLAERFKKGSGPMTTVVLLRAIANSGYIGALPKVLPYIDDKDEQIRATAIRAVQSMRDPRIDGIIAARLKDDSSAQVRISAIDAAKVREPSEPVVSALVDAGMHGDDAHLRYRAVELMADWLKKRPDLRATLDLVAKNDAEEKIRERAKRAL